MLMQLLLLFINFYQLNERYVIFCRKNNIPKNYTTFQQNIYLFIFEFECNVFQFDGIKGDEVI